MRNLPVLRIILFAGLIIGVTVLELLLGLKALGWCLFLLLAATVLVAGVYPLVPPSDQRRLLMIYSGVGWAVLTLMSAAYMSPIGPWRIRERDRVRIQHTGYFVSSARSGEAKVSFRGIPSTDTAGANRPADAHTQWIGFRDAVLFDDEHITLTSRCDGGKVLSWHAQAFMNRTPLRVGDECRNIPPERQLTSQRALRIQWVTEGVRRYLAVSWPGPDSRALIYDQGTLTPEAASELQGGVEIARRGLRDGQSLAVMLQDAWPDITRNRHDVPYPGATSDPSFADFLRRITLVRLRRDDQSSAIGILGPGIKYPNTVEAVFIGDRPAAEQSREIAFDIAPGKDGGRLVQCGLGQSNLLRLELPARVERDPVYGDILRIRRRERRVWPLPPTDKPFLIASSPNMLFADGYLVDTGNPSRPFLVRGRITDGYRTMLVADSAPVGRSGSARSATPWRAAPLGQDMLIGDHAQGISLRAATTDSAVKWNVAALVLTVIFACAVWLIWSRMPKPGNLGLAACIAWTMAASILTVRLIIAYRLAVLPPDDADARQVAVVFASPLMISIWALVGVPLAMMLGFAIGSRGVSGSRSRIMIPRWAARTLGVLRGAVHHPRRRPPRQARRRTPPLLGRMRSSILKYWQQGAYLLPLLVVISGYTVTRPNVTTKMLGVSALAALAAAGPEILNPLGKRLRAWTTTSYAAWILLCYGLWLPRDPGSIVQLFPISAALLSLRAFRSITSSNPRCPKGLLMGGAGLLTVMLFIGLRYAAGTLPIPFLQRVLSPAGDTAALRFVTLGSRVAEAEGDASGHALRMPSVLRHSKQSWHMMLNIAEARYAPRGYGGARVARGAMTYGTSTSDLVFSTWLAVEHGAASACLVLALYAMVGAGLLLAVNAIHEEHSNPELYTAPILAIALYVVLNTLYMAAANVNLVPFTGQDIPLLGLRSHADWITCAMLLCGACWMIARAGATPSRQSSLLPILHRLSSPALGIMALTLVWITYAMATVSPAFRRDHTLDDSLYTRIREHVETRHSAPPVLRYDGKRIIAENAAALLPIERAYIHEFHSRGEAARYDPGQGLYFVERVRSADNSQALRLRASRAAFVVRSPYRHVAMWRGSIVPSTVERGPTFMVLGQPFEISLNDRSGAETLVLGGRNARFGRRSVSILGPANEKICDLTRKDDGVLITPVDREDRTPWRVFRDGVRLVEQSRLGPNQVLTFVRNSQSGDGALRFTLLYAGTRGEGFAVVRWCNGNWRRFIGNQGPVPLIYCIGEAGDARVASLPDDSDRSRSFSPDTELALTIDPQLHSDLQTSTEEWARAQPVFRRASVRPAYSVSAVVVDAFSGHVLALPSWPWSDPSDASVVRENLMARVADREMLYVNHNMTRHVVGSTIKPMVLSTAAVALHPVRNRLSFDRLNALAWENPHGYLGGTKRIRLESRFGLNTNGGITRLRDPSRMDMTSFLVRSYDWPSVLIGSLCLATSPNDAWRCLRRDTPRPDFDIGGAKYTLDLLHSGTDLFNENGTPHMSNWPRSMLFRGLAELFGGAVTTRMDAPGSSIEAVGTWSEEAKAMFPTLTRGWKPGSKQGEFETWLRRSTFEPTVIAPTQMTRTRADLVNFLIGADPCLWSNLAMARAAARLASGRYVTLTLETGTSETREFEPLPPPLDDRDFRERRLYSPMEQVRLAGGTARSLAPNGRHGIATPPGYRILVKTGTMEWRTRAGKRGLADDETLMFVVGRWNPARRSFVPDLTVAGYLYLQGSKPTDDSPMLKFAYGNRILNSCIRYLQQREAANR